MSEIEDGLIYAAISNGEAFIEASSKINASHFSSAHTAAIWGKLLVLSSKQVPFDEPIIKAELTKDQKQYYDDHIKWQVVDVKNIQYYIDSILNKYRIGQIRQIGEKVESAHKAGKSLEELLGIAEQEIINISEESIGSQLKSLGQILDVVEQKIQQGKKKGITTSISYLDYLTNGLMPGQLTIVAGRPSMGKSAFGLQICIENALVHNIPFAVFSLEMSEEEIVERVIANKAKIETWKIRNGSLSDTDWEKLKKFKTQFKNAPFYVEDITSLNIATLRAKAKRIKMQHKNLGGILVDYLQLMESDNDNRVQAMSDISRGLKVLAKEMQIPVIAVSQLNRGVEQREEKRPLLSDLRESGSLEQDADMVMFLYREDYYKGDPEESSLLEINLCKHRAGPTGTAKSIFHKQFQYIANINK
jgi:replicative DNA helicase